MPFNYYLIYKPYQTLSQFSGELGQNTLANLGNFPKDVYPIGRLDKDSEGLLILTNDKTLNKKILQPKEAIAKTYWVQVEGAPDAAALDTLEKGVTIKHQKKAYYTKPCRASIIEVPTTLPAREPPIRVRANKPTSWLQIILEEGKNRQIRQMTAKVGFPTLRLVRVAIGRLTMGGMQSGKVDLIDRKDIQELILN